jgi:hypothetical protein
LNIGFAISDLVLALACIFIAVRAARARAGVALACATIGVAALVGALRFSAFPELSGAHRFLSLIGSTAALPLLAASLVWPDCQAARTWRGAALSLLAGSALGIAIVAGAGFPLWGQAVPALSAFAILVGAFRARVARKIVGAMLLVGTFGVVAAGVTFAGFAPLEILHYGMFVALLLLCL